MGTVLSLVAGICLIAQPVTGFADTSNTVDNSVDKSTTEVVGCFMNTYSCTECDQLQTVSDAKAKVDDSIPVKKEVKATVSGIYITDVRGVRGPLEQAPAKKKGLLARFRKEKPAPAPEKNSKNGKKSK